MVSIPFNGPFSPLKDIFIVAKATMKPADAKKTKYVLAVELSVENRSKQPVAYDSGLMSEFMTGRPTSRRKLPAGVIKPGKQTQKGSAIVKPGTEYALSLTVKRSWWKVGSSTRVKATG